MITRYGGGNDGIAEYLENGRKAEREYTRDELDHRLILDGDLQATNKVIQSIENKGQERYLHITLSFQESEISAETLKSVTQEYKQLFMNAYRKDEYCFYAEAHLPKIKNLVDNRTGELIERKPHIHIVIPRTNLVTENSMNPAGDITNFKTQEQLDAIQEHINNKYNLASPKDALRVSDQNYANVLSRTKGDLFNERNNDVKRDVFTRVKSKNIRSFSEFKTLLSEYGEVKIRNSGKSGDYLAVKLDGDKKFTNFKNPLFTKQYIESRELPLVKPTEKQISARIEAWTSRTSHEIKHIYPASSRIREAYKALDDKGKGNFLSERIKSYDEKNKLNKGHSEQARGRKGSNERGFDPSSRLDRIKTGIGLPRLPQRGLVYGIDGRAAPTESVSVLSDNAERDLAERLQERQHSDSKMRRDSDREQQGRGLKTVEKSFFLNDLLLNKLNEEAEKNELATMSKIRKDVNPERFLSAIAREFNIVPSRHAVSKAPDGSPRFSVGKRNLNASDFLTKHLNLSWSDAKKFLLKTYAEQVANTPFEKTIQRRSLTKIQATERFKSLKECNKMLYGFIRNEKKVLYNELRSMRSEIRHIPKNDWDVARGLLVYKKLTTLESLTEMEREGRNIISQYHTNWREDLNMSDMGVINESTRPRSVLERLRSFVNGDTEDAIHKGEPEISTQKAFAANQRVEELKKTNSRLKDLVLEKKDAQLIYRDAESEREVFTDKGGKIVSGKEVQAEEVAVMLEYAKEKYGGILKLTGSENFKQQCVLIAAEKGMNVILKPEQYQKMMLAAKEELSANTIHQPEASHTVEEVKALLADNEMRRMMMNDDQKRREFSASMDNNTKVKAEINAEIIQAKTGMEVDPLSLEQDVINAYNATLEPKESVYIVKFPKQELNENIRPFNSIKEAVAYIKTVSMLHGIDADKASVQAADKAITETKGIQEAAKDAVPVPRHELERAQGRDISEQDGKILEAIDQYQDKFISEGLEFDRPEMEAELLNHNLTRDVAEDRMEQKFMEEKSLHHEQVRDNGMER